MTDKLKRCPFCGGEAKINSKTMDGMIHVWVSCKECNGSSPIFANPNWMIVSRRTTVDNPVFEPAIKAWNRRVSDD